MLSRLTRLLAAAPFGLLLLFGVEGGAKEAAAVTGVAMAIDCDATTAQVDQTCDVPPAGAYSIDIVLTNNSGAAIDVGGYYFVVSVDETMLVPIVVGEEDVFNSNPDANDAIVVSGPGIWDCGAGTQPPTADLDPSPTVATSFLGCYNSAPTTGTVVDDGSTLVLATIGYGVQPGAVATTMTFDAGGADSQGSPRVSCDIEECADAIWVGDFTRDADGDMAPYPGPDNCPEDANTAQQNNDRNFTELGGYGKVYDDLTAPNADFIGDVCDPDDDNDGLSDVAEMSGPPCASASAPTSPTNSDSDGDLFLDGAECTLGTNPASTASAPGASVCGAATDDDGDGLLTRNEICFYGTDPGNPNTDDDVCLDGAEVASINADIAVSSIDLAQVAQSFGVAGSAAYISHFDMNKDGRISSIDLSFVAQRFSTCVPQSDSPDLVVSVSDTQDPLSYFNVTTYAVVVTNVSSVRTANKIVVHGVVNMSDVGAQPSCDVNGLGVACVIASLGPGEQAVMLVEATVFPIVPHNSNATSCFEAWSADEALDRVHDNRDCETTTLNPP